VTYDRGSEFIGKDFQKMIKHDYGIKGKPITVRNPKANAIVERVYQVIGHIIRTFKLEDNYIDEEDPWKGIFSATAFTVRSTFLIGSSLAKGSRIPRTRTHEIRRPITSKSAHPDARKQEANNLQIQRTSDHRQRRPIGSGATRNRLTTTV
jgi:transposase InsO family protein